MLKMIRGRVGGRVVVRVVRIETIVGQEATAPVLTRLIPCLVAASSGVALTARTDVRRLRTLATPAPSGGQTAVVGDGGAVHGRERLQAARAGIDTLLLRLHLVSQGRFVLRLRQVSVDPFSLNTLLLNVGAVVVIRRVVL